MNEYYVCFEKDIMSLLNYLNFYKDIEFDDNILVNLIIFYKKI